MREFDGFVIITLRDVASFLRLTITKKGLLARILMISGDWVSYFCPDKMYQTLSGFEPATLRATTWRFVDSQNEIKRNDSQTNEKSRLRNTPFIRCD